MTSHKKKKKNIAKIESSVAHRTMLLRLLRTK